MQASDYEYRLSEVKFHVKLTHMMNVKCYNYKVYIVLVLNDKEYQMPTFERLITEEYMRLWMTGEQQYEEFIYAKWLIGGIIDEIQKITGNGVPEEWDELLQKYIKKEGITIRT